MPLRSTILMDENRTPAEVDDLVGALVVLRSEHHEVHEGKMYQTGVVDTALANGSYIEVLVQVGAPDGAHMRFRAAVGGDCRVMLYEGPTFSAAGTSMTANNRNRRSSNVAGVVVTRAPTLTADGILISDYLVPGGTGGTAGGGLTDVFEEWVLDSGQYYLFRVMNISGVTAAVSVSLDWYEPGAPITT